MLDPGETWQFECERATVVSLSRSGAPDPRRQHRARAGHGPDGTVVTADAVDDVDVFVPVIDLTKLVDGQPSVTVPSGTAVTYTYAVANTGNTPLGYGVLVDDTTPCENPTRGADAPGNDDATLDVGETWTYSCAASPTAAVVNTAVVTATPLNPLDGNHRVRRSEPGRHRH